MTAMAGRLCGLLLLLATQWAAAAVLPVPALSGRVVDATGTLSGAEQSALETQLADLEKRKGSQIVVLLVPTTRPEAIEQFSMRVVEAWKPGREGVDDGVLLLVAKDDREVRIEVGYGLEGAIPDATANRIIDEFIVPRFRDGDFAGGIAAGVDRLIGLVDGETLPEQAAVPQAGVDSFDFLAANLPLALFVAVFAGAFFRRIFGQLPGAAVTGLLISGLTWLLAGGIGMALVLGLVVFILSLAPAGRGGRWASHPRGGFGGGTFGGRGGGGGFSGGGGGFGGGGASGRW